MRDYKEYEYQKSIDTMLDNKTSARAMPDEQTISKFRTPAYDNDFLKTMEQCGTWINEKPSSRRYPIYQEIKSENNLFINGRCSVRINQPINSLVVVGDIDENARITSQKIVHVSPEKSEEVLMKILENESQKGWMTKSEVRAGKNKNNAGFYVKRAGLLMKVFSSLLKNLEGVDDVQFVSYCKKLAEYSEAIKNETNKKH